MSDTTARLQTYFVVKEPGASNRILVLDTQGLNVGRSNDNDLRGQSAEMSRRHAVISRSGKSCAIVNRSGSNPTLVNGEPVKTQALNDGDAIRIAEFELTFFQRAENLASLGMPIEYASQLKGFAPNGAVGGQDGADSTMLGVFDTSEADDAFEVRPARDFEIEFHGLDAEEKPARDFDLELDDFGLDDLDMPGEVVAKAPVVPRPSPGTAQPEPVAATRSIATPLDESWTLDELGESDPVKHGPLALQLEIEGLTPELEAAVAKLLEALGDLPLRVRLKG